MSTPDPVTSDIRVYMRHARAARIAGAGVQCAPGIRAWCTHHRVDLHQLATTGIPIAHIEAIDDAYAQRAAGLARAEAQHG